MNVISFWQSHCLKEANFYREYARSILVESLNMSLQTQTRAYFKVLEFNCMLWSQHMAAIKSWTLRVPQHIIITPRC